MDTRFELVQMLENAHPNTPGLAELIAEAKAGEYHDYKNTKYDCGKVEASRKLRAAGLSRLAIMIESGDFDEEADEEDKAMMRKGLTQDLWSVMGLS